jgi:uracil-DNA glycosylase family 4
VSPSLESLREKTVSCRRCPELRAYCKTIARVGKREFAGQSYWAKPVPSIGPSDARLLIVGLAPGAHGSNRTGRMFTGDAAGAWLARAMHDSGFATVPYSRARGDGFAPLDAFITAALRCAPTGNKPTREQLLRCAVHMSGELELLRDLRVVIGLGKIGFLAAFERLREAGYAVPARQPRFAHLAEIRVSAPSGRLPLSVLGSYHPSRQNTNTGKLTKPMFDAVFARARELLENR